MNRDPCSHGIQIENSTSNTKRHTEQTLRSQLVRANLQIDNGKELALLQEGMKRRCPFQKYIIAFVSEFRSLSPETIGRGLLVPTREIRRPTRPHGRGILKKGFILNMTAAKAGKKTAIHTYKAMSNNLMSSPLLRFQLLV